MSAIWIFSIRFEIFLFLVMKSKFWLWSDIWILYLMNASLGIEEQVPHSASLDTQQPWSSSLLDRDGWSGSIPDLHWCLSAWESYMCLVFFPSVTLLTSRGLGWPSYCWAVVQVLTFHLASSHPHCGVEMVTCYVWVEVQDPKMVRWRDLITTWWGCNS